jgi:membrane dipeptidase
MNKAISVDVNQLLEESIIWDNHSCMPIRSGDTNFLGLLSLYKSFGASLVILNVTFDMYPWHIAFKMLATFRTWIKQHSDDYVLVSSVDDIYEAKRSGKLGICFDIEGGNAVDDLPELIEPYYALGVRWMLLAYNQNNRLAGGCQDEDTGLTEFGKRVIDQMNACGMVLCCTHTGYKSAEQSIEYSPNPMIFSHSNARAVYDHPRNIPDYLIKACAVSGGVINVNGLGSFLGANNDTSTETFVRHVEYIAELVGPEHVGIGLDYVYDQSELDDIVKQRPDLFPPEKGYEKGLQFVVPSRIPAIVTELVIRGWDQKDIKGLLGENNLRVAKQVWKNL